MILNLINLDLRIVCLTTTYDYSFISVQQKSIISIIRVIFGIHFKVTASLVYWLACLTTDHEVAGSIPGTSTNFKMWIRSGTWSTQSREDN